MFKKPSVHMPMNLESAGMPKGIKSPSVSNSNKKQKFNNAFKKKKSGSGNMMRVSRLNGKETKSRRRITKVS